MNLCKFEEIDTNFLKYDQIVLKSISSYLHKLLYQFPDI